MTTIPALILASVLGCSGSTPGPDTGTPNVDSESDSDSTSDSDSSEPPAGPELWFYASYNLQVQDNVAAVIALLDRAAAAGYHGVVLADFKISLAQTDFPSEQWRPNVAEVLEHAESLGIEVVPAIFPFGYSEGILYSQPDMAEGLPVVDAPLVASGGVLVPAGGSSVLDDGGFEDTAGVTFTAWDWQDDGRLLADPTEAHAGSTSAHVVAGKGNARVVQALRVEPRRQYHASYFVKTRGWSGGGFQVIALDTTTGVTRNYDLPVVTSDQDWTRYDFAFITGESTTLSLYAGVWTESEGDLWIDDMAVEETAFHNLIRRDGAPLELRCAGGTVLEEGVDFDGAVDPQIASAFDDWHTPPTPSTTLADGSSVLASFYAVTPIYGYQVGACLTEPAVRTWMEENLAAVLDLFPDAHGFFLGYDEMRHMDTCAACRARGLSPGALLATHAADAIALLQTGRPDAVPYVWSDMFDPYHNAHDNYYLVEGDISGSWEGLSPDTVVMNWNLGNEDSLRFFADLGHEQIIAGYYDSGDGYASAQAELGAGRDLVRGLMYTTWSNDWSQLETYAEGARAAW
jgi:hypothetical protein